MLAATHTHSGPGGYLQYVLYIVTSHGFIHQSFEVIAAGIVQSIDIAHSKITAARIYINAATLLNASVNRSPTAYDNNPKQEKQKYEHNTDKEMTVVKFVDVKGNNLGAVCWFAVHPVSMNNTNRLISGDNKGYASMLFEQHMNGKSLVGKVHNFINCRILNESHKYLPY